MAEWRAEQQNYHIKPVSLQYLRERTFQKLILVGKKNKHYEDQGAQAIADNHC